MYNQSVSKDRGEEKEEMMVETDSESDLDQGVQSNRQWMDVWANQ